MGVKTITKFLIIFGVALIIIAMTMDTSVSTGYGRVQNIGLISYPLSTRPSLSLATLSYHTLGECRLPSQIWTVDETQVLTSIDTDCVRLCREEITPVLLSNDKCTCATLSLRSVVYD